MKDKERLLNFILANNGDTNLEEAKGISKFVTNLSMKETQKILAEITHESLVNSYLNGMTVAKLMEKYKFTKEGIYLHLRRIPHFKKISRLKLRAKTEKRIKGLKKRLPEVRRMLKAGIFAYTIARNTGIPYEDLKILLKGTKYDNSHTSKRPRDKEIQDLYVKGSTQKELAKQFGVSQARISAILNKNEKL
jgi:Mor family transcriptional regulator